jgi:hypothetical protein
MFFSSSILWIGSLLIYLSSPNQKIITESLSKKITYPIFLVSVIMSVILLLTEYSAIIASLVVLTQVMVMWPSTVFILGHINPRLTTYIISGVLFFSSLSLLGGFS